MLNVEDWARRDNCRNAGLDCRRQGEDVAALNSRCRHSSGRQNATKGRVRYSGLQTRPSVSTYRKHTTCATTNYYKAWSLSNP